VKPPSPGPVRVKICGLTRAHDVQAAVAAGADALGFVFAPASRRVLEADAARQLAGQVPAFVARVGLFMDQDADEVRRIVERVPLNLLQFHGQEEAAYCRSFGLPYIKAVAMGSDSSVAGADEVYADACGLLLDSHRLGQSGGTGQTFDWAEIPALGLPLILAGGLTPANVRQAVRQVRPWAVDVSSGVEDAPGVKNADSMRTFIKEAKRDY
jgi:phosphoribosylanthranilate isomerase